jgi:hypothetical protein
MPGQAPTNVNRSASRYDEWIGARSNAREDVMAISLSDIATNAEIKEKIFSICDDNPFFRMRSD